MFVVFKQQTTNTACFRRDTKRHAEFCLFESRVFKNRFMTGYEKSFIFHTLFQNLKQTKHGFIKKILNKQNKNFKPCLLFLNNKDRLLTGYEKSKIFHNLSVIGL